NAQKESPAAAGLWRKSALGWAYCLGGGLPISLSLASPFFFSTLSPVGFLPGATCCVDGGPIGRDPVPMLGPCLPGPCSGAPGSALLGESDGVVCVLICASASVPPTASSALAAAAFKRSLMIISTVGPFVQK